MKPIRNILLAALFLLCGHNATAQNDTIIPPLPYTPDTVRYGDSNYYFAPRHGVPNAMCSGYHHSPNGQTEFVFYANTTHGWSLGNYGHDSSRFHIQSCYADSTISLLGVAWPAYLISSDDFAISLMQKDSTGRFYIVDSVHMHRPATRTCFLIEGIIYGDTTRPIREAIPLYHTYFKHTFDVSDSFYFAWSNLYAVENYNILATAIRTDNISDTIIQYRYYQGDDTSYIHNIDNHPYCWSAVLPIIGKGSPYIDSVACDTVTGFELYTQHDGIAGFTWDTLSSALWSLSQTMGYQVSCGPAENATEDNEIRTLSANRSVVAFTGLEPNREYKASIRVQCHHDCNAHDTIVWNAWQTPIYFTAEDTVAIALPEDETVAVTLLPNPATEQVTVRASQPIIRLTLCDLQGNILLSIVPQLTELTLPLQAYPKGSYLLSITTTQGSIVKKLIRR